MGSWSTTEVVVCVLAVLLSVFLKQRGDALVDPPMKVDQIFIYPIKSLPACAVRSAKLDARGFEFDRRFMLYSPAEGAEKEKNHCVSNSPLNTQIRIDLDHALECVTLTSPSGSTLLLHLSPPTELLERRTIDLYNSTVLAFDMGDSAAEWFTQACAAGRSVRLVYLGAETRPVLGSMGEGLQEGRGIAFTDHGSFLVATTSSLAALASAISVAESSPSAPLSIKPLRPNILLRPSSRNHALAPWAEDFWAELLIGRTTMRLTSNCVRCVSLNIDYATGGIMKSSGAPLGVLAKDRRVDTGSHSPVFGRYGFSPDIGATLSVGDTVFVTKRNEERTTFDWPY